MEKTTFLGDRVGFWVLSNKPSKKPLVGFLDAPQFFTENE